jgi:hypothetical protein
MSTAPCPSPTPTPTGVVVFSPTAFKAAFTSFATVADAALNLSFQLAQLQLNNTCKSRVCDVTERETLLNLLVAHITAMKDGENGNAPSGIVGQINQATQGSVSIGATVGEMVKGQAYYMQTQWGALYWASTQKYRRAIYVPAPVVCADLGVDGIPYGGFPGSGCGC